MSIGFVVARYGKTAFAVFPPLVRCHWHLTSVTLPGRSLDPPAKCNGVAAATPLHFTGGGCGPQPKDGVSSCFRQLDTPSFAPGASSFLLLSDVSAHGNDELLQRGFAAWEQLLLEGFGLRIISCPGSVQSFLHILPDLLFALAKVFGCASDRRPTSHVVKDLHGYSHLRV